MLINQVRKILNYKNKFVNLITLVISLKIIGKDNLNEAESSKSDIKFMT